MKEKEIWKDIPGYEDVYQVSDLGRVRSLDRYVISSSGRKRFYEGREMKFRKDKDGYLRVGLSKNGILKTYRIYSLVAKTFIGPKPENYQICHIDSDKLNNALSNLRYDTRSENNIDEYRNGNTRGMKFNVEEVLEIRRLYASEKYTQRELGVMFETVPTNINNIVTRKSFAWLNDDGTIDNSKTKVS